MAVDLVSEHRYIELFLNSTAGGGSSGYGGGYGMGELSLLSSFAAAVRML